MEIDGEVHDEEATYDGETDKTLDARGVHMLRFRNHEVRDNLAKVLERITGACRATSTPACP